MTFFGISIMTLIGFAIGFISGFAACFYGVKVRSNRNTAPAEGWGRFVGLTPSGHRVPTTESGNPSITWSRLLSSVKEYDSRATIKSLKSQGYKVDRY